MAFLPPCWQRILLCTLLLLGSTPSTAKHDDHHKSSAAKNDDLERQVRDLKRQADRIQSQGIPQSEADRERTRKDLERMRGEALELQRQAQRDADRKEQEADRKQRERDREKREAENDRASRQVQDLREQTDRIQSRQSQGYGDEDAQKARDRDELEKLRERALQLQQQAESRAAAERSDRQHAEDLRANESRETEKNRIRRDADRLQSEVDRIQRGAANDRTDAQKADDLARLQRYQREAQELDARNREQLRQERAAADAKRRREVSELQRQVDVIQRHRDIGDSDLNQQMRDRAALEALRRRAERAQAEVTSTSHVEAGGKTLPAYRQGSRTTSDPPATRNSIASMGLSANDERWISALAPSVQERVRALPAAQIDRYKQSGQWAAFKSEFTRYSNDAYGDSESLDAARSNIRTWERAWNTTKTTVEVGSMFVGPGEATVAGRMAEAANANRARQAYNASREAMAAPTARFVPNPNGRLGGLPHQTKVGEIAADMEARGLEVVREYRVLTPDSTRP